MIGNTSRSTDNNGGMIPQNTLLFFRDGMSAVATTCFPGWDWLYSKNYGLFNAILQALGLEKQPFLSSVSQALFCLCIVQIWSVFGYYAVILLAAMRGD